MAHTRILIGADPELFCQHTKTGKFVSAHDLVPGSKDSPVSVVGGAVQVDGVAAEFNVNPTDDLETFIDQINTVFGTLEQIVKSQNPNLILVAQPTAVFDRTYFDELPDVVKVLGCDPDFNAWLDGAENKKPDNTESFRTGGGHIHLGWRDPSLPINEAHRFDCVEMVKQLDTCLYVPSLAWDRDRKRQLLYGKMGAHRPKPYGVEYRSLSNAWLRDPKIIEYIFESTQRAHELKDEGINLYELAELKSVLKSSDPHDLEIAEYVRELEDWGLPTFPAGYLV